MDLEIIMYNMSCFCEWQKGISNRNYQVFKKLANHPKVKRIIAVDFLPFTVKRAARNWLENIAYSPMIGETGKIEKKYKGLTSQMIKISGYKAEVYVFSTINSIISYKLVSKTLNKFINKIYYKAPLKTKRVIWSYFPMTVDYFENIDSDLTVFDAVDNWIYHESFGNYRYTLRKNYKTIAKKSDLIFTVSKELVDFFQKIGAKDNVKWISNGVELKRFKNAKPLTSKELPLNIKHPIVGYIGTIQDRFRVNLVKYLAKKNPDKSFLIVGPVWAGVNIEKIKILPNVYLIGRVPYNKACRYIKSFDVGIIPHKNDRFVKYTNSLKILEYLACSKPVVTTPGSGVERFSEIVEIKEKKQEFNKALNKILKPDYMNKQIYQDALAQHNWKYKADKMLDVIFKKLS